MMVALPKGLRHSADAGSEPEEIRATTRGRGVDVAFVAAGEPEAVGVPAASVLPGGQANLAGIPIDDRTALSASTARSKGLTIKLGQRMKNAYPRGVDLVSKGMADARSLVADRIPLEEARKRLGWQSGVKVYR
jgi:L-iditol 2-dehydrogenase